MGDLLSDSVLLVALSIFLAGSCSGWAVSYLFMEMVFF